mgnify:CR=1 FL=1
MQQLLIGIILVLGALSYWLYNENTILQANNKSLEGAVATQEKTAKILAYPVEMQRKINNGTKHIMEDIEKLSSTVDDLDDGLQLQPNSN